MMVHAIVLVLGDVGRSPRMQYHALSLADTQEITRVTLIGYHGEKVLEEIQQHSKINLVYIDPLEVKLFRKIAILNALWKGVSLLLTLFITLLFSVPSYKFILIQNPPSIPVIFVALFLSLFNGSKVIIDWHNLGFSIYEQTLGSKHFLVKVTRWIEKHIVTKAHHHFCVSKAMKLWLSTQFALPSVNIIVYHDKPHRIFYQAGHMSLSQRHSFLQQLHLTNRKLFPQYVFTHPEQFPETDEETVISIHKEKDEKEDIQACSAPSTAIVITSTSWTADERVDMLLPLCSHLDQYLHTHFHTSSACTTAPYNRLLVLITGKGPMKQAFLDRYAQLHLRYIKIECLWLAMEDYPRILTIAHCGLSFHTSSSGIDLPMKVLDMFGSRLPVAAMYFPTIAELVIPGENGLYFQTQEELLQILIRLFFTSQMTTGAVQEEEEGKEKVVVQDGKAFLAQLKEGTKEIGNWDSEWKACVFPLIQKLIK